MATAFTVLSWNVEHFKGYKQARMDRIINALENRDADVFALYEVEGKRVFEILTDRFPNYSFHITEGRQSQEILVGVKNTFSSFFTQKTEFKSGNDYLRPGALLTLTIEGKRYSLLFLHLKSLTAARGFGLRDDMLFKAVKFRRVLDRAPVSNGNANYIFMGDLNTMGMNYPTNSKHLVTQENELKILDKRAKHYSKRMKRLVKTIEESWWNGSNNYEPSKLDHVVAADHLRFKQFDNGAEVLTKGWSEFSTKTEQRSWINKFSDHAYLYFEVEKV